MCMSRFDIRCEMENTVWDLLCGKCLKTANRLLKGRKPNGFGLFDLDYFVCEKCGGIVQSELKGIEEDIFGPIWKRRGIDMEVKIYTWRGCVDKVRIDGKPVDFEVVDLGGD